MTETPEPNVHLNRSDAGYLLSATQRYISGCPQSDTASFVHTLAKRLFAEVEAAEAAPAYVGPHATPGTPGFERRVVFLFLSLRHSRVVKIAAQLDLISDDDCYVSQVELGQEYVKRAKARGQLQELYDKVVAAENT